MEALLHENPGLRPFFLSNVRFTHRSIGAGAYGSVEEVEIAGAVCAAKQIHDFFKDATADCLEKARTQFVKECQLISRLRHPNIVQFLGVCVVPGSRLPALVMERLVTSLHDLLDPGVNPQSPPSAPKPLFPLSLKCSILYDVASGLAYLHEQSPPVIHRDLSARNVLLNSGMVAKIADLGVARILPRLHGAATMTKAPGAVVYMPPEALEAKSDGGEKSKYDASIDVFSFGVVSIFTLSQTFPSNLMAPTYRDKEKKTLVGRTELERREKYMKVVYQQLPMRHPLVLMITRCLDFPEDRPSTREVLQMLQRARAENGDEVTDMNKLELIRALRTNHPQQGLGQHEIAELRQQLAFCEKERQNVVGMLALAEGTITRERQLIQEWEEQIQRLEIVERENAGLKRMIDQQEKHVATLQREKEELTTELQTARAVAEVYKEDFEKERSDRARAVGKMESLQREVARATEKMAELQAELSSATSTRDGLTEEQRQVKGDLHHEYHHGLSDQHKSRSQPVLNKQSLSVPAVVNRDDDPCYVNIMPHCRSSPNLKPQSGAQASLVNVLSAKPPKPTPRSPLHDTVAGSRESEGPVIVISEEDEPPGVPEDVDGHSKPAEPGLKEKVDSFDAYDLRFKCLHCEQEFSQREEYWKHVGDCPSKRESQAWN